MPVSCWQLYMYECHYFSIKKRHIPVFNWTTSHTLQSCTFEDGTKCDMTLCSHPEIVRMGPRTRNTISGGPGTAFPCVPAHFNHFQCLPKPTFLSRNIAYRYLSYTHRYDAKIQCRLRGWVSNLFYKYALRARGLARSAGTGVAATRPTINVVN